MKKEYTKNEIFDHDRRQIWSFIEEDEKKPIGADLIISKEAQWVCDNYYGLDIYKDKIITNHRYLQWDKGDHYKAVGVDIYGKEKEYDVPIYTRALEIIAIPHFQGLLNGNKCCVAINGDVVEPYQMLTLCTIFMGMMEELERNRNQSGWGGYSPGWRSCYGFF